MSKIIEIEGLTKKYNGFTALDNLNLTIDGNVCVGYLGPNGAGKTTTIKILTGLLNPTSGKAYIKSKEVTKDFRSALNYVGAVVETPEFYPFLTPKEILAYFGKLRGMAKRDIETRTRDVLESVRLEEWNDKKIGSFSRGMKQRIALASALLHDPELLILDEPTNGLDPRGMVEVREVIRSLKKQGKTIFMSSHLLGEIQEVCDTVALLDKGKLLLYDNVHSIAGLSKRSRIALDTLSPPSSDQMKAISRFPGVVNVNQEINSTTLIDFNGDAQLKADLLDSIRATGLRITGFKPLESDLEALYLKMISESVR